MDEWSKAVKGISVTPNTVTSSTTSRRACGGNQTQLCAPPPRFSSLSTVSLPCPQACEGCEAASCSLLMQWTLGGDSAPVGPLASPSPCKLRVKPWFLISGTGELCVEASWRCRCVLWFEEGPSGAVFGPVCLLHSYWMSSTREKFLFPTPFLKGGGWGGEVEFFLMLSSVMGLSRTCSFKKCPLPHHPPSFQLQH